MYINVMHHKKNSPKNFIHNFSFEIYIQIFKLYDEIILSQIYSIHSNFSMFVGFSKIIDYKANQV